jgi:hypothetical protein
VEIWEKIMAEGSTLSSSSGLNAGDWWEVRWWRVAAHNEIQYVVSSVECWKTG